MALRTLFKRKVAAVPELKELAECESVWATETTRLHLRRVGSTQLHRAGGLRSLDILAACGTEVAWDRRDVSRAEVVAALPSQHASFHYCLDCLDFLGLEPQLI